MPKKHSHNGQRQPMSGNKVTCPRCNGEGVVGMSPGEVITEIRKARGLTQEQLVGKMNYVVSRSQLVNIEKGVSGVTLSVMIEMGKALGVSLDMLAGLEDWQKSAA